MLTATQLRTAPNPALDCAPMPAASHPVVDVTAALAGELFGLLAGLHGLPEGGRATVVHAAAASACVRAMDVWGSGARLLLHLALDAVETADASIAEVAACYACDREPDSGSVARLGLDGLNRALWIAAVLRLSEAVALAADGQLAGVHAAWTDTVLHIEFDGIDRERDISGTANHAAALEMLTGRTVMVTSSARRRRAA